MKIRKFNDDERSTDIDDLRDMLEQTSSLLQEAITYVGNGESKVHHEPDTFEEGDINKMMYDLSTLNNHLKQFLDGKSNTP